MPLCRVLKSAASHSSGDSLVPVFWESRGAGLLPLGVLLLSFLRRRGVEAKLRREGEGVRGALGSAWVVGRLEDVSFWVEREILGRNCTVIERSERPWSSGAAAPARSSVIVFWEACWA